MSNKHVPHEIPRKPCGTWRFCYLDNGNHVEQCDGCGKYRKRTQGDITMEHPEYE